MAPRTDAQVDAANAAAATNQEAWASPFSSYFGGSDTATAYTPAAPTTNRNAAQEQQALSIGYTQAQIDARGGINAAGYWNDVPAHEQLTTAEQKQVSNPDGSVNTAAMAAVLQDKARAYYASQGLDTNSINAKLSSSWGGLYSGPAVSGGGAAGGANTDGSLVAFDPVSSATQSIVDQIAKLTQQVADSNAALAAEQAKAKVVGTKTVRSTGGVVNVVQIMSDGSTGATIDTYTDFGAKDSVMQMFANTGLGNDFITSLTDVIDKVYNENIMPTNEQVLNSIYSSDAYKTRFAANEVIKKRMADGKGMPGDRLLSPKEYIDTENSYRAILQEAGLPINFYDTQEDFTNFIANGISPAEMTTRVNIASDALRNADQNVIDALQNYYGLGRGEMVAYLLDKDRAINAIDSTFKYSTAQAKQMYTAAQVGGAALRAGGTTAEGGMGSAAFAQEITAAGKETKAEAAFQNAAANQADYQRLLGLAGKQAGAQDLVREELALSGGSELAAQRKKLASQERARFATRSAIDRASLGKNKRTSLI